MRPRLGALVAVMLMLGGLVAACGSAAPKTARSGASVVTPSHSSQRLGELPKITLAQLPPEARKTLKLIEAGGPFPYPQDGTVFRNREKLLPREPSGYYHEYTVPTPGSPDRGARRIIAGKNSERYYTKDHYRSFAQVVQ